MLTELVGLLGLVYFSIVCLARPRVCVLVREASRSEASA